MVFEAPPSTRHEVQILTCHFQFSGQMEAVGPVLSFVNDSARESLPLYDVRLTPLTPGSPLMGLSRPHVVVRKPQVVLAYFASAETRASIHTLARTEPLVAYTPVAVCRGEFHMPAEARIGDFVESTQGELLAVTNARIFPLIEFPAPFPTDVELVLVGRSQLLSYHPA
jgi:hypothetical protein